MNDRRVHRFQHGGHELLVVSVATRTDVLPLTPAELAVARLVVRGLSNEEIARQRGRAVNTVANQVSSILQKLSLASRAQLASFVQPD